ncbi:MAG TPA: hypothetical protein VGI70_08830, partial [Polyangiales bacterium]
EHPCAKCGTPALVQDLRASSKKVSDAWALDTYDGACGKCGAPLHYELEVPRAGWPKGFSYGGDTPSELFTATEWRAMGEREMRGLSMTPSDLDVDQYFAERKRLTRAIAMFGEPKKSSPSSQRAIDGQLERYGTYTSKGPLDPDPGDGIELPPGPWLLIGEKAFRAELARVMPSIGSNSTARHTALACLTEVAKLVRRPEPDRWLAERDRIRGE